MAVVAGNYTLKSDNFLINLGANEGVPLRVDLIATAVADVAPIPLPETGWMLLAGLGGLIALRRRSQTSAA